MDDISGWLAKIGLQKFADLFEKNGIGIDALHGLTNEDLREIGIERLADRKLLLKEITQLAVTKAKASVERRLLSVLFCDLVGSTALSTEADPEELRSALRLYQDAVVRAMTKFGGFVASYMGDGVLAYFGWPHANEDQAGQAVRAGLEAVAAVKNLTLERDRVPHCRVGIATGRVVVGGETHLDSAFGETPNLAARLQALAAQDQVMIDKVTRNIIGNRFEVMRLEKAVLKGFDQPVDVWSVVQERKDVDRFEARRRGAPLFAGRNSEMETLLALWQSAQSGQGQYVMIHGEAGIGKSRLVNEFAARLREQNPAFIRFQCSPHHVFSAFHPVISHLEKAAGFASGGESSSSRLEKVARLFEQSIAEDPHSLDVIAALLSIERDEAGSSRLPPAQQRKAALLLLTREVLRLAAGSPLVAMIEDAHWIDPSTKVLLESIIDQSRSAAVMIVLTLRPTPKFALETKAPITQLTLGHLSDQDIGVLAKSVAGPAALSPEDVARIVSRADGVPLFAEEMASTALEREAQTKSFDLPETLQAALTARLDLLGDAKEVAQVGSVLGREFKVPELSALIGVPATSLEDALDTLVASGFLLEAGLRGETVFRFRHALVQDVAYESLLRQDRRDLHKRLVHEVLTESTKAREPEIVAHHLTEAAMLDEAVGYWKAAGARAAGTSANTEAIAHFSKGLELLTRLPEDEQHEALRFSLYVGLTGPLIASRGYTSEELKDCISQALAISRRIAHTPEIYAILYSRWAFLLTSGSMAESHRIALAFSELSEQQNDQDAKYARHRMLGASHMCLGQLEQATEDLDKAITLYDPAKHARLVTSYGVDIRVAALCFKGEVLWLKGHVDQAQQHVALALGEAKRSKHLNSISMSLFFCGLVAFLCRDRTAARAYMDEMMQLAAGQPIGAWPTLGRAMLGWVKADEGGVDEGLAMMAEGVGAARASSACRCSCRSSSAASRKRCCPPARSRKPNAISRTPAR